MHWLDIPAADNRHPPSFSGAVAARQWLAGQPQADPLIMQALLLREIEALDGSALPPTERLGLLDLLRSSAVPIQEVLEPRFLRKPLPLGAQDEKIFATTQRLWAQLAIAYLRIVPHLQPAERLHPLYRATAALRQAEYCHLQAARTCPALLDRLLLACLAQAEQIGQQRQAVADRDFRHLGESTISGHVAWAFLLRLINPYALSVHQLVVANRALSRWRELVGFLTMPDDTPKVQAVALDRLFSDPIPEGLPRWLDISAVDRKLRHRLAALQAGESPESLKLGRELSAAACIRLLEQIRRSLSQRPSLPTTELGEIKLSFGTKNAYTLFAGKPLFSQALDGKSASLAHDRLALFGFDRASQLPNAVRNLAAPSETWTLIDGLAVRTAKAGERHSAPCLIACSQGPGVRLGVMLGLHCGVDGALRAQLSWYTEQVSAGFVERPAAVRAEAKIPVFIMLSSDKMYLIAPVSAAIKLDTRLSIDGSLPARLIPTEVVERGADFVRYLCRSA